MGILDIFKPLKKANVQRWQELGIYNSTFSTFGSDVYASATSRACIRALADFTSKSTAKCGDEKLERILNNRPNMYMNGHDFLYKLRTRVELYNTAFIYIQRDDRAKVVGLYPVPCDYFEAVEYLNGLFIKFHFESAAANSLTLPWEDLAVLRKDYNRSDVAGDDNSPILQTLQMVQTTDEGLLNSIKATANLRGILKSTKAMLAPDMVKEQRDQFVKDYMTLENAGGIASLDATQEFTPITMKPETATFEQMKEIRENVYRYYGVNDEIIMGTAGTEALENFYELRVRPFLVALSQELTSKIYTGKAAAFAQNRITYIADNGQFMTMTQKIELFNKVVEYGGMTINEWRDLLGLAGIENGDKPIMRLDAAHMDANGRQMSKDGEALQQQAVNTAITQEDDDIAGLDDDEYIEDEELEDDEFEELDELEDEEFIDDESDEEDEESEDDDLDPVFDDLEAQLNDIFNGLESALGDDEEDDDDREETEPQD